MAEPFTATAAIVGTPLALYNLKNVYKNLKTKISPGAFYDANMLILNIQPKFKIMNCVPKKIGSKLNAKSRGDKQASSSFTNFDDEDTIIDYDFLEYRYNTSTIRDIHENIDFDASSYLEEKIINDFPFKLKKLEKSLYERSVIPVISRGINSFISTRKLYSDIELLGHNFGYDISQIILGEYINGGHNRSGSKNGLILSFIAFSRLFELFISQMVTSEFVDKPVTFELLNIPDILLNDQSYTEDDYFKAIKDPKNKISLMHQCFVNWFDTKGVKYPHSEKKVNRLIWHYTIGKRLMIHYPDKSNETLIFHNIPFFSNFERRKCDIGITHLLIQENGIIYVETALNGKKERLQELEMFHKMHTNGYTAEELINHNAASYLPMLSSSGITYYPRAADIRNSMDKLDSTIQPVSLSDTYHMTTIFTHLIKDHGIFAILIHDILHECAISKYNTATSTSLLRTCFFDVKEKLVEIQSYCERMPICNTDWVDTESSLEELISPEEKWKLV